MRLSDLIASKDGSLSLTKLAAATGHFLMACGFVYTLSRFGFIPEAWMIYSAVTVMHASYDKTLAVVAAMKNRVLDASDRVAAKAD